MAKGEQTTNHYSFPERAEAYVAIKFDRAYRWWMRDVVAKKFNKTLRRRNGPHENYFQRKKREQRVKDIAEFMPFLAGKIPDRRSAHSNK